MSEQEPLNHVEPGGPPLRLVLTEGVELVKVSVGPMDNNAYLVTVAGETVLIDAAAEPDRLLETIGDRRVTTVVTTHRHADHLGALAEVAAATGARLVCGAEDALAVESATGTSQQPLRDGGVVPLGRGLLDVLTVPGHTPGSVVLGLRYQDGPDHLFTGDSLFPGGPGRTESPEDFRELMDHLEHKVFRHFTDDTVVHPGHGDDTTIGRERPHLQEWRQRGW
ncbi:MBL fold metallo-hydrolase [Auraticoccus sp. F435]|uniref:MBL fold metallo-hydrolase n=1 Tax=Auraticoccus cholistanensis TaxID=2656650 RepID=A0A6A9UWN3_9ACTN|nr:MBL fold metallo-hydrolase [Auraticoccus cholistanensis]MVA77253.1 MBL fold metallo-hydrolase [Auraticoccus cholistanensis]